MCAGRNALEQPLCQRKDLHGNTAVRSWLHSLKPRCLVCALSLSHFLKLEGQKFPFSLVPSLPLAPLSLEAVQRLTEYYGLFTHETHTSWDNQIKLIQRFPRISLGSEEAPVTFLLVTPGLLCFRVRSCWQLWSFLTPDVTYRAPGNEVPDGTHTLAPPGKGFCDLCGFTPQIHYADKDRIHLSLDKLWFSEPWNCPFPFLYSPCASPSSFNQVNAPLASHPDWLQGGREKAALNCCTESCCNSVHKAPKLRL